MDKAAKFSSPTMMKNCSFEFVLLPTAVSEVIEDWRPPPMLRWAAMDVDIKAFVQSFLVCTLSGSGSTIPRPLGQQIHATRVFELLHFGFLYLGESRAGHEYILILKDKFSRCVFLEPCKNAHAETTANVLMEYFSTFVPVLQWFSDQGPRICNTIMQYLSTSVGVKHLLSTVYEPWSDGTVESVCKEFYA